MKVRLIRKSNEAVPPRDTWKDITLESSGLDKKIIDSIKWVAPKGAAVEIYAEQPNAPRDDQMVDIKFKVRVSLDDDAALVYDGECAQAYTGEGEFGFYDAPKLTLIPSKESDFPVNTSVTLKGFPGGGRALTDLGKQIRDTLNKVGPGELFKISPKAGTIYAVNNCPAAGIYDVMRDAAVTALYPEEDTDYAEFDYDTAERILYSYFDDYMLQYTNAAKKIKKEVTAGKVFASLSDMQDYATNYFADEYSAEELKDIVIDGIENPRED